MDVSKPYRRYEEEKDDRCTEGVDPPPQILLQEMFVRLEKDFKYNLSLLKIREVEIERCAETNRNLQDTLAACLKANAGLKTRIDLLETALDTSEKERDGERKIFREKSLELDGIVAEKEMEKEDCERDRETEVRRSALETERKYVEILNRKEMEYKRRIEELQSGLEGEAFTISKLTHQIESSFEECTILRNKLRETQSKYARETSIYLREIETLRRSNEDLASTISIYEKDSRNRRLESSDLKRKLRDHVDRFERELTQKVDRLTRENAALKSELGKSRNPVVQSPLVSANEKIAAPSTCAVSDHRRFPLLLKQNGMLREIVKTIRKEREMTARKRAEELRSTERRVEKLEDVIDSLKRAAVSNAGTEEEDISGGVSKGNA